MPFTVLCGIIIEKGVVFMSERTISQVCANIETLYDAYSKTDYAKKLRADAAFGCPVIDSAAQLMKNYRQNAGSWGTQSGDANLLSVIEKGLTFACKEAGAVVKEPIVIPKGGQRGAPNTGKIIASLGHNK